MPASTARDLLNVVALSGVLRTPPELRVLPSGVHVTCFDVKVRSLEGPLQTIRASWVDAPAILLELHEGEPVVITGRVRTYWTGRRSATDVFATSVVPLSAKSKVRRSLGEAMAIVQTACP